MSVKSLIKLSGIAGIMGGLMVVLTRIVEVSLFGSIPESVKVVSDKFIIVGVLGLLGSLLIVIEIIGTYALIHKRMGIWDSMAYLLFFTGALLGLGSNWTYAFAVPQMAMASPSYVDAVYPGLLSQGMMISYGIAFVGTMLVGGVILFRKVLPRWVGAVMILSYVILFGSGLSHRVFPILTNLMIAAGPIALGYAVMRDDED